MFPEFDVWPLGFVFLMPLMLAIERAAPARAFFCGYLMGLVYFAGSLSWVHYPFVRFGGASLPVALALMLLLAAYLAIYPALFGLLASLTRRSRWPMELRLAFLWVATEGLRGYLLTGAPWNLAGHALHSEIRLLQLADLGGVYGLSFFLALINGGVLTAIRTPSARRSRLMGCLLLLAGGLAYGSLRLAEPLPGRSFRVGVVQHNPDQARKWERAQREGIMASLLRLTDRTLRERPRLVIWPEAATPFRFRHHTEYRRSVGEYAASHGTPILLGSLDMEIGPKRYYNAAMLVEGPGELAGLYRKTHLVPIGEFQPRLVAPLARLSGIGGSFHRGDSYEVFEVEETRLSVAICFESSVGELVRRFARAGAQLQVILTNDSWLGETAGTTQHLRFLPFRAVENRRPVVQAAQSGYSAAYDQKGRLLHRSSLGVQEQFVVTVYPAKRGTSTLYTRFGNWVVFVSWATALLFIVESLWRRPAASRR